MAFDATISFLNWVSAESSAGTDGTPEEKLYKAMIEQCYRDAALVKGWSLFGQNVSIDAKKRVWEIKNFHFPKDENELLEDCDGPEMRFACEVINLDHSRFMKRVRTILSMDFNKAA